MESPLNSATRSLPTQPTLLLLLLTLSLLYTRGAPATTVPLELHVGFRASPGPSPASQFQPILNDPSGNFFLGFLRVSKTQLTLAVTHLPSLQPLWQPQPQAQARWSSGAEILFNGSIVVSDPETGAVWSTGTSGDRVVLHNTSNLVVEHQGVDVWESFGFPQNTLVESQNFSSNMTLVSSNGLYSMSLGEDFMAMYARFDPIGKPKMYWRHKALEAKADVVPGNGPIYARVEPDGFLGMYQTGTGPPVDVQAFNSFNRQVDGFLIVRLEPDGNLRGYSWNGTQWVSEYQAISDTCEMPSPCGPYGLCQAGSGSDPCSCLDNRTRPGSGRCFDGKATGDFCDNKGFEVMRRKGVELPFKELMGYETVPSLEECEGICERNCTCWGAVYNNGSGFCYLVGYPIQTLLGSGDQGKSGYFKMRRESGSKGKGEGLGVGLGVLGGAILTLVGFVWFAGYRVWTRRRGVKRILEEDGGVSPGPYKDLGSASFKSIEMFSSK